MSMRCSEDHNMTRVGYVWLDPKTVEKIGHPEAREVVAAQWMKWEVWRCEQCAETLVYPTEDD